MKHFPFYISKVINLGGTFSIFRVDHFLRWIIFYPSIESFLFQGQPAPQIINCIQQRAMDARATAWRAAWRTLPTKLLRAVLLGQLPLELDLVRITIFDVLDFPAKRTSSISYAQIWGTLFWNRTHPQANIGSANWARKMFVQQIGPRKGIKSKNTTSMKIFVIK